MKRPENVNELFDELDRFRKQLGGMSLALPPSPAKQMIDDLLQTAEPLVHDLRQQYPAAVEAMDAQREESAAMVQQARDNVAKARETLANVPPKEAIRKGFVPPAPELPAGLSAQYAGEMRSRYAPAPPDAAVPETPATAWQDWTVN